MVARKSRSLSPTFGRAGTAVFILSTWVGASGCRQSGSEAVGSSQSPIPAVTRLPSELGQQVLAKVGDRTITLADYALVLDRMDRIERMRYQTPERRRALLDEIINSELLAKEAERRGLDRDPATIAYVDQLFRDEVRRRLRAEIPSAESLPVDEVQAYFAEHRDEFRSPELRRVAAIALPNGAAALKLVEELGPKPSIAQWNTAAIRHSVESTESGLPVEVAGDLGLVAALPEGEPQVPSTDLTAKPVRGASQIPSAVRAVAFALQTPGDVQPKPVNADNKWYLVRLMAINPARALSQEEVESTIRSRLVEQRLNAKYAALEGQLTEHGGAHSESAAEAK